MKPLSLDLFISSADDQELSKYKVLASMQNSTELLHKNKLYPTLAELINIYTLLKDILAKKSLLNNQLPDKPVDVDLNNKELSLNKLDEVFEFIKWAMPQIKEAINEGRAIFDFVDEQMKVQEVGILPIYKNEGYFFIPDNEENVILIYRFEMNLLPVKNEQMHTLRTNLVEAVESDSLMPETLKIDLIKQFPELPNPATYSFNIEMDFPFNETILPVAKRKLIRRLPA